MKGYWCIAYHVHPHVGNFDPTFCTAFKLGYFVPVMDIIEKAYNWMCIRERARERERERERENERGGG